MTPEPAPVPLHGPSGSYWSAIEKAGEKRGCTYGTVRPHPASLHEAAFDDGVWPATAGLIDAACGLKGNHLVFGAGSVQWDTRVYFARFCLRGQRRRDLEQWYFREYWFRDERVPRLRELPDGVLVPIRELYAEAERKTSATYNEALPAGCNQDGLNVRRCAVLWCRLRGAVVKQG